jgi:NAD(P)-dependent dehydrogenase (short-subunit alcohol dehydrogenase family)
MSKNSHAVTQDDATVASRRGLLRGAGLATAAALLGTEVNHPAEAKDDGVVPAPVFFPTPYKPELSLLKKNIVVTGASRGIGRATALELVKAGARVWGTSRTPLAYPAITEYPLLEFHLEDPASIAAFVPAIDAATNGRVDALINNAGQFVFGGTTPTNPALFALWAEKSAFALQVIYLGHRMLTSAMLSLMQHSGYRRILFTASTAAYASGAGIFSEFYQPYVSGKRAIADFANSLRDWFSLIGLDIGVATVNPVFTHTDGPFGLRPIFTEPVDSNGNPDKASPLAVVLPLFRAGVLSAQPPTVVARAYRQLLELNTPHPNVIAGVGTGPLAAAGRLPLILAALRKEMENSAMPWKCGDA